MSIGTGLKLNALIQEAGTANSEQIFFQSISLKKLIDGCGISNKLQRFRSYLQPVSFILKCFKCKIQPPLNSVSKVDFSICVVPGRRP